MSPRPIPSRSCLATGLLALIAAGLVGCYDKPNSDEPELGASESGTSTGPVGEDEDVPSTDGWSSAGSSGDAVGSDGAMSTMGLDGPDAGGTTDDGDPSGTTGGPGSTGTTTDPAGDGATTSGSDTGETTTATSSEGTSESGEPPGSTGGVTDDTIYEIQQEMIEEGADVEVLGVVVTAVGNNRFWAAEPAGGAYSGIVVFAGMAADDLGVGDLAVGDVVDVTGTVEEFFELTEINVSGASGSLTVLAAGAPSIPDVVPIADLSNPETAEPWESTLIRIEGPVTVVADISGGGEYPVSDGDAECTIDNFIYDSTQGDFPGLAPGATFDAVQGLVTYFAGTYRLMPRSSADLEGYTAP